MFKIHLYITTPTSSTHINMVPHQTLGAKCTINQSTTTPSSCSEEEACRQVLIPRIFVPKIDETQLIMYNWVVETTQIGRAHV